MSVSRTMASEEQESIDIMHTVKSIFSAIQKLPIDKIDTSANLFETYSVDSLKAVKLLSTLEVELDMEIPEADMQRIQSLDDVCAVVARLLDRKD